MNRDLDALTLIRELSNDEAESFKTALHTLLSRTFIIRGIDREKELYDFTIRNIALFDAWFSCMDAVLVRDESLGVISFRGAGDTRLRLNLDETCAVLVFRQLYEDKKREISLTAFPVITIADFQRKFNAMTGGEIKKTSLINVLHRLSGCKLVAVDSPDFADGEGLIRLYPSIPFSLDREGIDESIAALGRGETGDKSPLDDTTEAES
ncbi:hypothetical protein FACS189445_5500 [Spirochaetia bacterium]|nr:hypothetical protein FACS189445_5500 [Spirochaetia bacterium]